MGAGQSTEQAAQKVYRFAKSNDTLGLQDLFKEVRRRGNVDLRSSGVLEFQDTSGFTPLLVAAAKGNLNCVILLLQSGANIGHVGAKPECTTALHEAVARGYTKIVDVLLQYGASPFVENGRSLTAVDLAINLRNAPLVRKLETRAPFYAQLMMKVPKYMGLGSEWKLRWCVIMPRYPNPHPSLPAGDRVVRNLLVCYKGPDQYLPICKVWLDGASARSVVGSKGASMLQCALTLHVSHATPGGAHVTGDSTTGCMLHLRPADGSALAAQVLQCFMTIVNGGRPPPPPSQGHSRIPSGASSSNSPALTPTAAALALQPPGGGLNGRQDSAMLVSPPTKLGSATVADPAASIGQAQPGPVAGESDEGLARRLQEQYDAEAALYLLENPGAGPLPGMPASSSRPSAIPSGGAAAPSPLRPSPALPSGQAAAVPHYPTVTHISENPFVDFSPLATALPPLTTGSAARPPSGPTPTAPLPQYPSVGASISPASAPQMQLDANGEMSFPSSMPAGAPPPPAATATSTSSTLPADGRSWFDTLPPAPTPQRTSVTPPLAFSPGPGSQMSDDDEGQCVVCLAAPATAGFLHGDSVHKCCCKECAQEVKNSRHPTCPLCRQPIDHVILAIY